MDSPLNKPLSGKEVREAILFDIASMLENDDRLAAHLAYDGFSFKASISISLPSAVLSQFSREIAGQRGELSPEMETDSVEAAVERYLQSPNEVRYQSQQPIPILTTDAKGNTVEQAVSYVGKQRDGRPKGRAAAPGPPPAGEWSQEQKIKHNVVKGVD